MAKAVVIAVAVCVFIGLFGYLYLRSLRGSLDVTLPSPVKPGESFRGHVALQIKKDVGPAQLVVRLIGEEITEESRGDRTYEGVREFFREEKVIEATRTYFPGETLQREFTFTLLPKPEWPLTVDLTSIQWKVQAKLETSGIDLFAEKTVGVRE